jgi:two-component system alkaline phosphatase synthesis response regulator PhoP
MENSILIVEDDDTMRAMLQYNISQNGYTVEAAPDGHSCLKSIAKKRFDLVLLDLMLPEIDGMVLCKEIKERSAGTSVIIVSAKSETATKIQGFRLGADDYVTKPFSMEELLARIKSNIRKNQSEQESKNGKFAFGDLYVDSENYIVKVNDFEIELSSKEFKLLSCLASNHGKAVSRQKLAERIWGYSYLGDTRTIDVHIKNLRKKINQKSKYDYIQTVRGLGYKFKTVPHENQ